MNLAHNFSGILHKLGLDQRRCACCLEPFSPLDVFPAGYTTKLCGKCLKLLAPLQGKRCSHCGMPLREEQEAACCQEHKKLCAACQKDPPPWIGAGCFGLYEGLLRNLILRLKFGGELSITPLFADMALYASQCLPKPDIIVAIPQYPARLRERGFNQAHEIARSFCKLLCLPLALNALKRIRKGIPQEQLSALERKKNLDGAFYADSAVSGKTIWLIDDVMTTGSTLRSACAALLEARARQIYALFIARTPL